MNEINSRIDDFISANKDEIISDLSRLVAVPSVLGEPSEDAPFGTEPKRALDEMKKLCDRMGFKTTVYGDAVLCADYLPEEHSKIELGILAHLDVVPVERANWNTEPFSLTEKDGVLFGRGTIDDKGPAVAALWALNCVKSLGIKLKSGVRLIFGTDEENGSEDLKIYKKYDKFPVYVFTPDGSFPVINIEKGMLRSRFRGKVGGGIRSLAGGSIPNAVPDRAELTLGGVSKEKISDKLDEVMSELHAKGARNLVLNTSENKDGVRVTCCGRAAHASTPETGENAVTALIKLIGDLVDDDIFKGLERLFPYGETDGASLGLKCSDNSGALTCVLSTLRVENGEISGTIDIRFPTCTNLENVRGKLAAALQGIGLEYEMILGDEPHVVPEDSEFVKKLLSVYEESEGEPGRCIAIGGGTYVHNIEGGVAFGAERGDTDYHMHGDNEFITKDELLKDAALFAKVIAEICG